MSNNNITWKQLDESLPFKKEDDSIDLTLDISINIKPFETFNYVQPFIESHTIVKLIYCEQTYFAIDEDGKVWTWGTNNHGQLANGKFTDNSNTWKGNECIAQKYFHQAKIVDLKAHFCYTKGFFVFALSGNLIRH